MKKLMGAILYGLAIPALLLLVLTPTLYYVIRFGAELLLKWYKFLGMF